MRSDFRLTHSSFNDFDYNLKSSITVDRAPDIQLEEKK